MDVCSDDMGASSPLNNKMSLSLIIPVYNQASFIKNTTISYYTAFLHAPQLKDFEIILVSNNCTDETPAFCRELSKEYKKIVHVDYPFKTLKGGAVIRGFQHAKFDFLGFTDADMATRPEEFLKLVGEFHSLSVGAVIASRHATGAALTPPQPLVRRFLGIGFAAVRELLFGLGINDSQCGAKIFRRESIVPLTLTNPGFSFDVEFLYRVKKKGCSIKEVGILWQDRPGSTVNFFSPFFMLMELIKLRLTYR